VDPPKEVRDREAGIQNRISNVVRREIDKPPEAQQRCKEFGQHWILGRRETQNLYAAGLIAFRAYS